MKNVFSSFRLSSIRIQKTLLHSLVPACSHLLHICDSIEGNPRSDTISVYKELNEIRANIESIEGQLKYYSTKTDYSTVRITLKQSSVGATLEDTPWKPLGVLKDAGRAYISFLKVLGTVLIYFIVFTAPVWVIYGIYRVVKKNSGR